MRRTIISILITTIMSMCTITAYAYGYDFSAQNEDGVTIYYRYIFIGRIDTTHVVVFYSEDYSGRVVIPESVTNNGIESKVVGIAYGAFSGCVNLTEVVIPNSVTIIDGDAFYGCI